MLPTIPLEASLLYKDNLHLSEKGLRQVSGIILFNLYQVLAPNSYKPRLRRKSKSGRNTKISIVHSLGSGKVEMFLCAACHAFTPHVNAWKR